jgi:hypothetical protein
LYALESSFYVPLNTRLRGSIVREILDACLTVQDAKPLQFPGIFVRKADIERVPTDSFLYLSLTKRMIVEENPGKWKIFFWAVWDRPYEPPAACEISEFS